MKRRTRRFILVSGLGCLGLLACVVLAMGALLFGGGRAKAADTAKNKIVYGLTLMPSGFDPYINSPSEMGIALRSVYDTLVYRDPATKLFVPGLAASTDIAADGLTYTFKLRTDVVFHDGTPFNAVAVAHTLDRIIAPDTHSQKARFLLGPYDHYTIVDPFTIQIVLKRPYAPLLDGLAQFYLGIASPKALDAVEVDRYQFHQVGTGPFMMVEYIPGDHLTLRRNPAYKWGPAFYHLPATDHAVDEITFRFFEQPATRTSALESGEAQVMGEIPPTDAALLAGNENYKLYPQAIPGMPSQFFFNTAQPPTDALEVRQALLDTTNRAAIVDAIFQQFSPPAVGPLNAVTPFALRPAAALYAFNTANALTLLNGQGYGLSTGDKILTRNGQPFHLVMIVPNWGFHPEIAQQIQSQWRELGIDLELRQVPNYGALLAAQKKGDYNLIAVNDFGVDASLLGRFYGSAANPSWTGFKNAELDSWLGAATASNDPKIQSDTYAKIQGRIMDQALVLPIRDYVNLNGASARVGGLTFDSYGWYPLLANLTLDAGAASAPPATPKS